jgi:hypothetical protein
MPYVTIILREGRSVDQKREMVSRDGAIARTTNAKPEAVPSWCTMSRPPTSERWTAPRRQH